MYFVTSMIKEVALIRGQVHSSLMKDVVTVLFSLDTGI